MNVCVHCIISLQASSLIAHQLRPMELMDAINKIQNVIILVSPMPVINYNEGYNLFSRLKATYQKP